MADTYVSGGRRDNDTTIHDLYVCGGAVGGVIDVWISNNTGAAVAARLTHAPLGAVDDLKHNKLPAAFSIPANESWTTPRPIKMAPTDVLRVTASAANSLSFTYDGIEVN